MSLRLKIEEKYKNAIKNKNIKEINTLRLIKSAIKDKDIESRTKNKEEGVSEPEIMSLLQHLIKQRNDSIESFKSASRDDLIDIEQSEINIISEFLPKQKDQKETELLIDKIINDKNYETIKDMGKLMGDLKTNYSGSLDMALAGKIAKSKFNR